MEVPIIKEIVIIFALSIAVLMGCHRLRLPPVVGFLITGVLCGPHGLGFVGAVDDVENLATIGVVLLLFTVGMEFSLKNIAKYKYYFFGGGVMQIGGALIICQLLGAWLFGISWQKALFLGFLVSLSSTAIVLRVLDEKGESETPQGRLILGILIFQDIVAVPMMLIVPMLSGSGEQFDMAYFLDFLKGIAFLVITSIIAFRGVPKLLYYVTQTRSRELFLVSVLTICFAVAWITSSIGLSLSLGAFLAGLVISESEYSDEAVGNVLPFQTIFTSFFFVSMGMLLDTNFVIQQPFLILLIAVVILFLKALISIGAAIVLGLPIRAAILAGVAICQVGEFAFVIAHTGMEHGLATEYQYQLFLAVSLLTMAITPTMMALSTGFARFVSNLPIPQKLKMGLGNEAGDAGEHVLKDHVIIAGFGIRGRHLAKALKTLQIPYIILEMNPETVRAERLKGEPIHYGDPSHPAVLSHAKIRAAGKLVVVINDPVAARRIIQTARSMNPEVYIIARTRYFQEVQPLFHIGANDVIPDEFGSSLEIFTRVLQKSNLANEQIAAMVGSLRVEGYELLHWHNRENVISQALNFSHNEARIETLSISQGSSLHGKTVVESELKKMHGLNVLLIKRENRTLTTIEGNTTLMAADSVVVVGTPENLTKAKLLFQTAT